MNIQQFSPQEACDYAVQKIVEQRVPCTEHEVCMYGNKQGHHCAIGWLLDPNEKELMSYRGTTHLLSNQYVRENIEIFSALQKFHDSESTRNRLYARGDLQKLGIDTSGTHWQAWVDLGI